MNKSLIFFLLIFLFLTSSCLNETITGNGKVVQKQITTDRYNYIETSGSFDIVLVKGKEGEIKMEGEENILELMDIKVEGDKLLIESKPGYSFNTTKPLTITIPVETISFITLEGSGNIISKDTLESEKFKIRLSGSGNIDLNLKVENKINAEISGSGNIKLKGEAKEFVPVISGSGNIKSKELIADKVRGTISGSGTMDVNPKFSLDAKISGSGEINYLGNPNLSKMVTGSGDVNKLK